MLQLSGEYLIMLFNLGFQSLVPQIGGRVVVAVVAAAAAGGLLTPAHLLHLFKSAIR